MASGLIARRPIVIVGAGLAGTMLGIMLAARGYRIEVFERRLDPRSQPPDRRRSINLALSARGSRALSDVALLPAVIETSVRMQARAIHAVDGNVRFQPFGRREKESLRAVERHTLNNLLLDAAEQAGVALHFGAEFIGLDVDGPDIRIRNVASGRTQAVPCARVIGADGARSAVRRQLVDDGFSSFTVDEIPYGYKELPIASDDAKAMEFEYLHLWPRQSLLMIANPNPDGSFSCTAFLPDDGSDSSFAELTTPAAVHALFEREFPDAAALMPNLASEFLGRPTGRMPRVQGGPWHVDDRLLLIGDAAHAIVPFFAQGMNAAFEDCTLLVQLLDTHDDDWRTAAPAFYRNRRPDTNAIADMAMQNYDEIRERVMDPRFQFRKEVEQQLMRRFPDRYTSMHVLVMFTDAPYEHARACGVAQAGLLDRICASAMTAEQIDWQAVAAWLDEYENAVGLHGQG